MSSSKFFSTGDSDYSSASESSGSESEVEIQALGGSQQVRLVYSSSESEEEKRVVKTAKEKHFEALQITAKAMRHHVQIGDWTAVAKDLDGLMKQADKAKTVFNKEGVPTFFVASLSGLEWNIEESFKDKDLKKKLSQTNAKSLNTVKSKLKKILQTNNDWAKSIAEYNVKNPRDVEKENKEAQEAKEKNQKEKEEKSKKKIAQSDSDEDSDDDESDSEDDKKKKPAAKKPAAKKKKDSSSDESSDDSDDESSEDSSDDSDSDDDKKKKKPAAKKPVAKKKKDSDDDESDDDESDDDEDDDDEDDDDEDDDEDDSSSDEEGPTVDIGLTGNAAWFTREFWVKKEFKKGGKGGDSDDESESESSSDEEERAERKREKREQARKQNDRAAAAKVEDAKKKADAKKKVSLDEDESAAQEELKPDQFLRKFKELLSLRGKRGTDASDLLSALLSLRRRVKNNAEIHPAALLKLNVTLAATTFDVNINKSSYTHMSTKYWRAALEYVDNILSMLKEKSQLRLSENENKDETWLDEDKDAKVEALDANGVPIPVTPAEEEKAKVAAEKEKVARVVEKDANGQEIFFVVGSLLGFSESLSREFNKSLRHIDPHSLEYVDRLKDETPLLALLEKIQGYYSATGLNIPALESKVAALRLELIYYRYHPVLDALRNEPEDAKKELSDREQKEAERAKLEGVLVPQLAQLLYKHGDPKLRNRSLLMHVFWLALHNRYSESRALLLMSRLHDSISDNPSMKTRILYNRALAQLGLAAFHLGEFRHCLDALAELHQSGKIKELLAQGVSMNRWADRDALEEEQQRRRQYPYHQHINLDSLEAAHLLSGMLLEVPNLAVHGWHNKRRIVSRLFRRMWEHHLRQAFNGPPENTRDLIMSAAKYMAKGDWQLCIEHVSRLRMWNHLVATTRTESVKNHVLTILKTKIQEESLRTYLVTYAAHFKTLSTPFLANMFELDQSTIHRVASRLMISEQLQASWDEPLQCLVIQQQQATKLQKQALSYSEKALLFLEQNEKLLDFRPQHEQGRRNDVRQLPRDRRDRRGGNNNNGGFRPSRLGRVNKPRQ